MLIGAFIVQIGSHLENAKNTTNKNACILVKGNSKLMTILHSPDQKSSGLHLNRLCLKINLTKVVLILDSFLENKLGK